MVLVLRKPAVVFDPAEDLPDAFTLALAWVKRSGQGFQNVGHMSQAQAASIPNTIAAWKGTVMNHERPILETELPIDGSHFERINSPVVRRPVFAI